MRSVWCVLVCGVNVSYMRALVYVVCPLSCMSVFSCVVCVMCICVCDLVCTWVIMSALVCVLCARVCLYVWCVQVSMNVLVHTVHACVMCACLCVHACGGKYVMDECAHVWCVHVMCECACMCSVCMVLAPMVCTCVIVLVH